ncbi:MAG: polyprenyl synthetase family protein [Hydrogenobaculum sp.]|nr:MAG: polyprenyl synthetase family protein [Hydrogenobaculum sp.]
MIFDILKPKIEKRLRELLTPFEPKVLYEAMSYYVFQEGKRIRPVLSVIGGYACALDEDDAITLGCAIEFIHNYSLIHDDMPELDNDNERRGKPTCHKVFGQDIALLAGDGLLSLAFDILSDESLYKNPKNLAKVVNYVSKNAGIEGMVAGQVYDIKGEKDFLKVASLKTAALIKTSLVIPSILKGVDFSLYEKLGYNIGILFQLVDDFKDKDGAYVVLGEKPLLELIQDYKNNILTLITKTSVSSYLKEYVDFISFGI